MKRFKVLISETAVKQLSKLALQTKERIKKRLLALGDDPLRSRPLVDIKKLKGFSNPSLYRLRIGDFRVIYTVEGRSVKITEIFRREKGYKWLD